jgi:cytochrome c oxidase subunit II
MTRRTWVIVTVSVVLLLALGGLYGVLDVWVWSRLADAQIDTWSKAKYNPLPAAVDLPIEVVGRQFEWRIRYPSSRRLQNDPELAENFGAEASADRTQADDVVLVNELRLWKGASVRIHLKSADVVHSLRMPNLRLQQEAVPGKVTPVWLCVDQSNVTWDAASGDWKPGDQWEFACAEHGGQGPTQMKGQLFVHETKDDFLRWLRQVEAVSRRNSPTTPPE